MIYNLQAEVRNSTAKYRIDNLFVESLAKKALKKVCRNAGVFSLEILFVGDKDMRKLNKRFKGRGGTTDVLSFGLGNVGSIAISLDTAARNAKTFGAPFHEEVLRYVIHGILHLFGYNDDTKASRLKMAAKEDVMLRSLCANTKLSKVLMRP